MLEEAEALVAVNSDFPAGLADAEREVRFVPPRRDERLVEHPDAIDAGSPDSPWTNHRVNFEERKPVARRRPDGALQAPPVDDVVPLDDRLIEGRAGEAAAETQQSDVGISIEDVEQLAHEPFHAYEHVIVPG